jgi:hypothetical protein
MNERTIRDAFRTAIVKYCSRATASGRRTEGLVITITVTTAEPLSVPSQKWIYDLARDHTTGGLRAAEPVLSFPDVPELPDPGFQFVFHPPAVPRQPPAPAVETPPPPPEPSGPVALLTLRYDANFIWPCRIGAAEDWLAIGRWIGPALPAYPMMMLPTYATWLPRGSLLLLRNHRGRFVFGRSYDRPHYEIRIDGFPMWPTGSVAARDSGSIEFTNTTDGSSTVLGYIVDWEGFYDG